jgi:enoyl-CoA hydratase/carnithine racemase
MEKVRVEANGAARTVVLARADKRNALDAEMLAALKAAFEVQPPPNERLTVIRAEGGVFCAGLDLRERGGETVGAPAIEAMLHAIELYPLPVVAVVQGDAIAGGNELALHCDFVVASEAARFGMSLARIGLAPSWFLAKKLLEVMGPDGRARPDLSRRAGRRARRGGAGGDRAPRRQCTAVAESDEGGDGPRHDLPR